MIPEDRGPTEARPQARLFRVWMAAGAALAVLPVWRSWQLTGDGDTAATTLAVFAGAAWQIGEMLPHLAARPRPLTRWAALLMLAAGMWQLAWVGTDDFWFLRVALVGWAALWLALAWGVAGWVWGWRILAAFALWAWLCDSPWQWSRDAYQTGDSFGPALAVATARVAGIFLTLCGADVQVSHQLVKLGASTVSVGVPCTALPLVKLLWLLLLLATLLLRLSPLRACWLALIAALIAFATSVARVMLLVEVAHDPGKFHYWHDPDRGGVGWFTAAGMLILAFCFARQYFGQRLDAVDPPPRLPLPIPPDPRWLIAATALAACCAWLTASRSPAGIEPPVEENFLLVRDLKTATPPSDLLQPNQPAWTRQMRYTEPRGGSSWSVLVAYLPQTLEPDPRDQPKLDAALPPAKSWRPLATGGFSSAADAGGEVIWLAAIAPGVGALNADGAAWRSRQRIAGAGPDRLAAWLLHRAPLRDKRSYWLGVWGRPDPGGSPPKLFSDWIALLRRAG